MRRLIIEMGMGVDLTGGDYTKAAQRAVRDCLGHSALPILHEVPGAVVRVTIGVQRPEAVDTAVFPAMFPVGEVEVAVRHGGMDVGAGGHVVASAAVEVFLPAQDGWRIR
ncbi:Lin0512 family protein [Tropicibacter naphthalenivorans]|uniref:Uncharacterized protein n=1 Tax=Tropicibacter naphthalenivorans TaxID=441103 RepID=A0A0P1G536_9RHOB|nr:Lin0512 family protein [Tropicibacter naphthalenivorans]CUH76903.1 hypothetical protein TRN7648_01183 [Tropicibacter naphthalenivorans]SMC62415.1 conserved hypothetical protein [Tropicibacter naphthalenivorans]